MERQKASQRSADSVNLKATPSWTQDANQRLVEQLFLRPLFQQQARLWSVALALLLLSLSQGVFLLLAGPLLKAFFEFSATVSHMPLAELIPPQILRQLPALQNLHVPATSLTLWLPSLLLLAGVVKGLASYIYLYQQSAISLTIAKHYRDQLFAALLQQPYERLAKTSAGRWMSVIMNDVMVLQARFSDLVGGVLKDGILVLTCNLVLVWVHWPTAILLLAMSPVLAYGLGRSGKRISHFAESWQRSLADMTSLLLSMRLRFDFIRSQGGEKREASAFDEHNQSYFEMVRRSLLIRSILAPSLEFLGFVVFALLILMITQGIWFEGDFSGVVLIQFFTALGLVMRPLRNIGEQVARFQETKGSLNASLETFKTLQQGQVVSSSLPAASAAATPALSIDHLLLGYNGHTVFTADKLRMMRGQVIAIIGPSGSGKSTLMKSFAGLIKPLRWEGEADWEQVANQSAYVSQKTFLFDDTVAQNLAYGHDQSLALQEMKEALATVNLLEDIQQLPNGLETAIQSVQHNFSGGQLQRLMVARALLRDKDILLLDESTSAIDAKTEEDMIRRLINRCRQTGQILLFVTHRLRWMNLFDQVWFVENGRLELRGTHQELQENDRYQIFLTQS